MTITSHYWKPALWVIVYQLAGMAIGHYTSPGISGWYQTLEKSPLTPPNILFPVAWSVLYVLIALAGWRVWQARRQPDMWAVFAVFVTYSVLNWGWSFVFFSLQMAQPAFLWLLLINMLSLVFMGLCWSRERRAALFMVLPTLWTLFAAYLNYSIVALN
jgi:benzodiazapine receptor